MASGRRSSIYYDDELRAVVSAWQERGVPPAQLLRERLGLVAWDGRVPWPVDPKVLERVVDAPGCVSRGGPSAGVVRERQRLRSEGLKVVAPHAALPHDSNVGTPRATFRPPPFETVPDHDDGGPEG